jgi:hypothetical protein
MHVQGAADSSITHPLSQITSSRRFICGVPFRIDRAQLIEAALDALLQVEDHQHGAPHVERLRTTTRPTHRADWRGPLSNFPRACRLCPGGRPFAKLCAPPTSAINKRTGTGPPAAEPLSSKSEKTPESAAPALPSPRSRVGGPWKFQCTSSWPCPLRSSMTKGNGTGRPGVPNPRRAPGIAYVEITLWPASGKAGLDRRSNRSICRFSRTRSQKLLQK